MKFKWYPRRVVALLAAVAFLLLLGNIGGIIAKYYFGHDHLHGLVPLFNFDEENNFPSLFSALLLLGSSALLCLIGVTRGSQGKNDKGHWNGLALVFLFLAMDESMELHEKLDQPVRNLLDTSGALYFAWVIPYALFVAVLGIVYFKFILRLPPRIRFLFIMSGIFFLSGAIGFELIGSQLFEWSNKTGGVAYRTAVTLEESFEI
ncbi:MAG: hypothetical protein KDD66_15785, partial [Bdellovibrionales bacterium]|nr:hypothetical protein [Bdellovibrionales bacterium]